MKNSTPHRKSLTSLAPELIALSVLAISLGYGLVLSCCPSLNSHAPAAASMLQSYRSESTDTRQGVADPSSQRYQSIREFPTSREFRATRSMRESFGQLPLSFIENRGQVDARVAYYIQGR